MFYSGEIYFLSIDSGRTGRISIQYQGVFFLDSIFRLLMYIAFNFFLSYPCFGILIYVEYPVFHLSLDTGAVYRIYRLLNEVYLCFFFSFSNFPFLSNVEHSVFDLERGLDIRQIFDIRSIPTGLPLQPTLEHRCGNYIRDPKKQKKVRKKI